MPNQNSINMLQAMANIRMSSLVIATAGGMVFVMVLPC